MFPIPTHIYPDGTKAARKPKDGEIFHVMKNNLVESTWQWDDVMTKWVNITSSRNYGAQNTATHVVPPQTNYYSVELDNFQDDGGGSWGYGGWGPEPDKCECGSASVGHPGHSFWCKMYKKP